ncbi:MAG: nucleoside deaminase [Alphaproteobacteria bacterium]|nr:nucleoside deaminase [Alphaproteobacteria bacterium]
MAEKQSFMELALEEARLAAERGEVPVGAIIVKDSHVIARSGNANRQRFDVTAHAEIVALRAASASLESDRLPDCDLYVTLEPCTMCAAAISFARIRRLYFGAEDEKGGAVINGVRFFEQATCHHAPEIYAGIGDLASAELLQRFFKQRR